MFKKFFILISFISAFLLTAVSSYSKENSNFIDFKADSVIYKDDTVRAKGNVVFTYGNFTVRADSVNLDINSRVLTAENGVTVNYNSDNLSGEYLKLNIETKEMDMLNVKGSINNLDFIRKKSTGKIFFNGKSLIRTDKEINVYDLKTTTCDKKISDYYILSNHIIIVPENRLIIEKPKIFFYGNNILNLPSLVFSLKPRSQRNAVQTGIPKIGNSQFDGLGIKEALNYNINDNNWGIVHLDYFSKSGFGKGLQHFFDLGEKGSGFINYYRLNASNTDNSRYEYSASLNYLLPYDIKLNYYFSTSLYEYPGTISYPVKNSTLSFTKQDKRSNFLATYSLYNYGFNLNQGVSYYSSHILSPSLKGYLSYDYSRNQSVLASTFNSHPYIRFLNRGDLFDTELSVEDISGTLQNGLDRLPEISFLSKRFNANIFDIQAVASYGIFNQKAQSLKLARSNVGLNIPYKYYQISKNISADINAFTNQRWYQNNTSQRVMYGKTGITLNATDNFFARFDYLYQNPKGSSPFAIDQLNYFNKLSGTLNWYNGSKFLLSAGTARNFANRNYQDLLFKLNYMPDKNCILNFGTNYNINTGNGLNMDAQIDMTFFDSLNLRYWCEYNLQNKTLITQDFSIVKDFHCWESRLTYRGITQELWFEVALKAFPYDQLSVGTNQTKPILPY